MFILWLFKFILILWIQIQYLRRYFKYKLFLLKNKAFKSNLISHWYKNIWIVRQSVNLRISYVKRSCPLIASLHCFKLTSDLSPFQFFSSCIEIRFLFTRNCYKARELSCVFHLTFPPYRFSVLLIAGQCSLAACSCAMISNIQIILPPPPRELLDKKTGQI